MSATWLSVAATLTALATLDVTVAHAAQQRQSSLREWTLTKEPTFSLGGDGAPEREFLRIAGVFRLSSGRVAVVNGASNEIRLFDTNGKLMRTFGRTGSGPGEFRFIGWVGRLHDTLFVDDANLQRVSSVACDSVPRLVRSIQFTAKGKRAGYYVAGRLGDGRWLVMTYTMPGWDGPPGVHRLPSSAGLISSRADGEVAWLAERPGMAMVVYNPTGNIKQASVGPIAFSPGFFAVASGQFVWWGESGSDSLERLNVATSERRSIRLPLPAVSPSPTLVSAARSREESMLRGRRGGDWVRAKYSAKYLPKSLPRFDALLPGLSGELWVQHRSQNDAESVRYLILNAEFKPIASLRAPQGFRVVEVGADHVLGVHEDADGVETVQMYGLTRK